MRVPSGGNDASGALLRIMIQLLSSQLFAGKVYTPVKVAPACNRMVSPQSACFKLVWNSSLDFTSRIFPCAGVSASELRTKARGSSAGPSKWDVATSFEDFSAADTDAIAIATGNNMSVTNAQYWKARCFACR